MHVCLAVLIYVFVCMISWMIHPPCEITDQLAHDAVLASTRIILTLRQVPKMHHCQTKMKEFSGEGTRPLSTGKRIPLVLIPFHSQLEHYTFTINPSYS